MLTKASLLRAGIFGLLLTLVSGLTRAQAEGDADKARTFVLQAANNFISVIHDVTDLDEKRQRLLPFVEQVADVEEIARFCIKPYWDKATAEQQREYVSLYRKVLVDAVIRRMGKYADGAARIVIGRPRADRNGIKVPMSVKHPNFPEETTRVDWIVSKKTGSFRVVDAITDNVSLRQTDRDVYASVLRKNDFNLGVLLELLRKQAWQG
jgi:phospholipid transport system substrate-binding protein